MANMGELKAECIRNGISLEKLAEKIGINNSTLYRKINGNTEFNRNELQIIRECLKLSDEQFIAIFLMIKLHKCKKGREGSANKCKHP